MFVDVESEWEQQYSASGHSSSVTWTQSPMWSQNSSPSWQDMGTLLLQSQYSTPRYFFVNYFCESFYRSMFQQSPCLLRHREPRSPPARGLLRIPQVLSNHPWHNRNLPPHTPGQICGHSLRWGHRTILPPDKTWEHLSHCRSHNTGFLLKFAKPVFFIWNFYHSKGRNSPSQFQYKWKSKRICSQQNRHNWAL